MLGGRDDRSVIEDVANPTVQYMQKMKGRRDCKKGIWKQVINIVPAKAGLLHPVQKRPGHSLLYSNYRTV